MKKSLYSCHFVVQSKYLKQVWYALESRCVYVYLYTSMLTQEGMISDGSWFGKCVELVEPFSGNVKL